MPSKQRKKATATSAFGTPGRINHDASEFYGSRMYQGLVSERDVGEEQELPAKAADRFVLGSSEAMTAHAGLPVHLMVTSPPYNAKKAYDDDLTLNEYRQLLRNVWQETYRVLAPGGRAAINVANLGRKPYIPLHMFIIQDMVDLGFMMRGEIIWDKAASASPSTAWGSWRSASNPCLRDIHEYILVFSKGRFNRPGKGRQNTIERDDFMSATKSVWQFPAERANKVGHPAPFPEELPRRLIELYTFAGDVVLDPFSGAGTTCLAAARQGRRWVGYDIDPAYIELAEARMTNELGEA